MDPATIAAAVVAAIAPYLAKAAGKIAEGVGEAAVAQGGKLFDRLRARFAGAPAEAKQLQDLQAAPHDPLNRAAVQKLLRDALQSDPALLKELAALLGPAAGPGGRFSVQANTIGNVTQASSIGTLNIGDGGPR
jgi:hypothetical protein